MNILTVLWLQIGKLSQMFMCSYFTAAQFNPYCDLVGIGFEVSYVPAETLGEISLLCHQRNTHDY